MTSSVLYTMPWAKAAARDPESLLTREWLVTNGFGGYASGSISGACTRRYHGLLVAALPSPLGRTMMLNHLSEELQLPDGSTLQLGGEERPDGTLDLHSAVCLAEFRLESGLPVWRYETNSLVLEKRVLLPHRSNTVHVIYHLVEGQGRYRLRLRPSFHFRPHEASVAGLGSHPYRVISEGNRFEVISQQFPPLRLRMRGDRAALVVDGGGFRDVFYRLEQSRGYEGHGTLWSPGYFRAELSAGAEAALTGSTEIWEAIEAIEPQRAYSAELERRARLVSQADPRAQSGVAAELVLSADQFIITPTTRVADAVRAHATGDEVRSVIAGYHWFTDWGRDTMISLEGLTLTTGRHAEAGYILRTFAQYVRDGLIPNMFPEGENEGLYHTADATLWFFHAIDRYLDVTGDRGTLKLLLPTLRDIIDHHLRGTRFGIHVDPADGLLAQGEEGYQLTWMDAKVDGWVVTPRRGKAVEINALWYNALRLVEGWLSEEGDIPAAHEISRHADQTRDSFNLRFWDERRGYLLDIVDGEHGDDPAFRPNQVFAISLRHPVLQADRRNRVLSAVIDRLLTPVGLRSLAPGETDFKPRYDGDLRSRDAAYHQGTVWGWLIGPFVDAWLRVHPEDRAAAREWLVGFAPHLGEACIGSISEIFDAQEPYTPRGCVAQAWSVAEVLRCWVKTSD